MARGDHIKVRRTFYTHHGIDLGNGKVIHLPAEPGRINDTRIQITTIKNFLRGGELKIVPHEHGFPPDEVVTRAASRLDETGYHLLFKNCEHFARWCACGDHYSHQVERGARRIAALSMAGRVGLSYVAKRAGSRTLARAVPVVGPVLTGVAAAGAVVNLLSRRRSEEPPPTDVQ